MNIFSKLLGETAAKPIEAIGGVVDSLHTSDDERSRANNRLQEIMSKEVQSARSLAISEMQYGSEASNWFDRIINGLNRLPRPIIVFWVIGMLFDWWSVPETLKDPTVASLVGIVIGFFFGQRMIAKELPAAMGAVSKLWQVIKK